MKNKTTGIANSAVPAFKPTLEWAAKQDVSSLGRFIYKDPEMPLFACGNGGRLSVAYYFATCYSALEGVAKAISDYDINAVSDRVLQKSKVMIISRKGDRKNIDGVLVAGRCLKLNPAYVANLSTKSDVNKPNLVREAIQEVNPDNSFNYVSEFDDSGFIDVTSVLTDCALICKAFTGRTDFTALDEPEPAEFVPNDGTSTIPQLKDIDNFIILYGSWGEPAARDLECKFVESTLGSPILSNYRNYCHGKYSFAFLHTQNTAIILLASPREKGIVKKIRDFRCTPKNIPVITIETDKDSPLGALELMLKSAPIIFAAGSAKGHNPTDNPSKYLAKGSGIDSRYPRGKVDYNKDFKKSGPVTLLH